MNAENNPIHEGAAGYTCSCGIVHRARPSRSKAAQHGLKLCCVTCICGTPVPQADPPQAME